MDEADLFFREVVHRYVDTPRFVRRDWLAADVDEAMADDRTRVVLLVGEPGVGKSGFVAQLARDHPAWPVYLLRRDQRSPLADGSARSFLIRVGLQLAAAHPELVSTEQLRVEVEQRIGTVRDGGKAVGAQIDRILSSPFHQARVAVSQRVGGVDGELVGVQVGEWIADPRLLDLDDLADMALVAPARALARLAPAERLVLLVDALDEGGGTDGAAALPAWLASVGLPANVRVVVTSRPDERVRVLADRQGDALRRIDIDATDRRVRGDLLTYARLLFDNERIGRVLADGGREVAALVDDVVAKADGNVGYLDALGRALDQAPEPDLATVLSLAELPDDLAGLHRYFLRRIKAGPGAGSVVVEDPASGDSLVVPAWSAVYRPVIRTLSVAFEPLTVEELAALSGAAGSVTDVAAAVTGLRQFLDEDHQRVRFYHATFVQSITSPALGADPESAELYVDAQDTHRKLGGRLRRDLGNLWSEQGSGADRARRRYGRAHLLAHLEAGQDWDGLFAVLDEPDYVRGRLREDPSTFALCADLDRGRAAAGRRGVATSDAVDLLPRMWRYSLLRTELSSHADELPDAAYVGEVLVGDVDRAARLAPLLTEAPRRARVLGRMAVALAERGGGTGAVDPGTLLAAAATAARAVGDPAEHAAVVAALVQAHRDVVDAGAKAGDEALHAFGRLARSATSLRQRVTALTALAGLHRLQGDDDAHARTTEEIAVLINGVAEGAERDDAVADYLETAVTFGAAGEVAEAASAIGGNPWALFRAVLALAPDTTNAAARRLGELEAALAGAADPVTAAVATAHLAAARAAVGERDRARDLAARTLTFVEEQDEPDASAVEAIADQIRRLDEPDLLGRLTRRLGELARASSRDETGPDSYSLPLYALRLVQVVADVGRPADVVEVARTLATAAREVAVLAVARSFVRCGDLDTALALAADVSPGADRATAVRISFGSGPVERRPDERIRCEVVEELAARGRFDEARRIAEAVEERSVRAEALAALGVALARDGDAEQATALLAEVTLLGQAGRGRLDLRRRLGLLVAAGAWDETAWDEAEAMVAAAPRLPVDALVDALVDAGRLDRARAVIGRMALPRRITRLLALPAPDGPADPDRVARLLAGARSSDDPADRTTALLALVPAVAADDPAAADALVLEAAHALETVPGFTFRPTPWPEVCAAYVHAGSVTAAVDLARRLVEWETFDGAEALRLVALALHERDPAADAATLLEEAAQVARRVEFPPKRAGMCAQVAAAFVAIGLPDRATTVAVGLPEWGRREVDAAVARQLAGSGRVQAALDLLPPPEGRSRPGAHLAVLTALLDVGEKERAVALARTITEPLYLALALATVAGRPPGDPALASEALALLRSSTERAGRPEVDEAVARALVGAGLEDVLLEHLRDGWAHTIDTFTLTQLFDPVTALLPRHPELARSLAVAERDAEQVLTAL